MIEIVRKTKLLLASFIPAAEPADKRRGRSSSGLIIAAEGKRHHSDTLHVH
jgi:hypothetical protein